MSFSTLTPSSILESVHANAIVYLEMLRLTQQIAIFTFPFLAAMLLA